MLHENDGAGLQKEGYEDEHPSRSTARAIPCDLNCVVHPSNPSGVTLPAKDTHSATFSVFFCFLTSFPVSECES